MIVFISNFISEHQIPLCEALNRISNGEFYFVATEQMWEERIKLGFVDQSDKYAYVIKYYENYKLKCYVDELVKNADIVIFGDAPFSLVQSRIEQKKLTFRYTERYYKKSRIEVLDPRVVRYRLKTDFKYRKSPFYLLCAGAYVAGDAALLKSYPNKMYKWGYFPQTVYYENIDKIINNKIRNSLLWVGRFIDWKHPDIPIRIASQLKHRNLKFQLTMVGTGPLLNQMKNLVKKWKLTDYVTFTGAISPECVRKHMERNEVFVFSSDRNEGWGVVLNESMNAACVPIASRMIGAVPYLIENGKNGIVYNKKDIGKLADYVDEMFRNIESRKRMATEAYKTIVDNWNAENAAIRLVELSDSIINNKPMVFQEGICSKASIM